MIKHLLVLLALSSVAIPAAAQSVSDLHPIPLQSGSNAVHLPDGRQALILLGWKQPHSGLGYDLYVVLVRPTRDGAAWRVAAIPPGADQPGADAIRDTPQHGTDMVRAVRFAIGRIDQGPASLLVLTATRQSQTAPSAVTYVIYQLDDDLFKPVLRGSSTLSFCNANAALSQQFGLPLRSSYRGPRTVTGCPSAAPDPVASAARSEPAARPQRTEDCAQALREQRLTLCQAFVFDHLNNRPVAEALRTEWVEQAARHPQCTSHQVEASADDVGQGVLGGLSAGVRKDQDRLLSEIVSGCMAGAG